MLMEYQISKMANIEKLWKALEEPKSIKSKVPEDLLKNSLFENIEKITKIRVAVSDKHARTSMHSSSSAVSANKENEKILLESETHSVKVSQKPAQENICVTNNKYNKSFDMHRDIGSYDKEVENNHLNNNHGSSKFSLYDVDVRDSDVREGDDYTSLKQSLHKNSGFQESISTSHSSTNHIDWQKDLPERNAGRVFNESIEYLPPEIYKFENHYDKNEHPKKDAVCEFLPNTLSNEVCLVESEVFAEDSSSGQLVCACNDCVNQTGILECNCENCVLARDVITESSTGSLHKTELCGCAEICSLGKLPDFYVCECVNCLHERNKEVINNNYRNKSSRVHVSRGSLDQINDIHRSPSQRSSKDVHSQLDRSFDSGTECSSRSDKNRGGYSETLNANNSDKILLEQMTNLRIKKIQLIDGHDKEDPPTNSNDSSGRNYSWHILHPDYDRTDAHEMRKVSYNETMNPQQHHQDMHEYNSCNYSLHVHDPSYVQQSIQADINKLSHEQCKNTEHKLKKRTKDYDFEITDLKKDNDKPHKFIQQNVSLISEAITESSMQHEITRLTTENLNLREVIERQTSELRKLKKLLEQYTKRLKEGEVAEIQAEVEQEKAQSEDNVVQIKHKDRTYMGMLEYKKEDENLLIKVLILDLKPKVASGLLAGLPAYLLFMCVHYIDHCNDDGKVKSLLTNIISGIKKVVKRHHNDLERVTLWLANTCRFLHTLKQYSGEKQFQQENTPSQNECCLKNFDLTEYRQVFSDLAVWIYHTLVKLMEVTIQPSVVAAVLEHEAIVGLTSSRHSDSKGHSSNHSEDSPEHSLDRLTNILNHFVQVLTQHSVDLELVKQLFGQVYYFLGASALNNLMLRKELCNWSKGMQIRYNLSSLEQWLRDNKLQESGAGTTLEPIIQASQLLQARKTDADVDSVCEMCSKLTTSQIVKILNLYTPVDEFEEQVPVSFIRRVQEKLKLCEDMDNSLLMDLNFSFPVKFPFSPSKICLEMIEVPAAIPLSNVLTRL